MQQLVWVAACVDVTIFLKFTNSWIDKPRYIKGKYHGGAWSVIKKGKQLQNGDTKVKYDTDVWAPAEHRKKSRAIAQEGITSALIFSYISLSLVALDHCHTAWRVANHTGHWRSSDGWAARGHGWVPPMFRLPLDNLFVFVTCLSESPEGCYTAWNVTEYLVTVESIRVKGCHWSMVLSICIETSLGCVFCDPQYVKCHLFASSLTTFFFRVILSVNHWSYLVVWVQ